MTTPPSDFQRRLIAIVALCSFIAVSCGSAVAQTTTERAVEVDAPAAAPAAAPPTHGFGVSLEEFGDSVRETDASSSATENPNTPRASADATTLAWDDLIPDGFAAEEIYARFEAQFDAIEIGSPESVALYDLMQAEFDPGAINPELDGQKVWLAGFVAPLTYEDDIVTEFLLVPTFGACIHVPPPPPNQTIMVSVDKEDGLSVEDSWGAVWVEGTITVASTSTDIGDTSYTIVNATSGVYNNF